MVAQSPYYMVYTIHIIPVSCSGIHIPILYLNPAQRWSHEAEWHEVLGTSFMSNITFVETILCIFVRHYFSLINCNLHCINAIIEILYTLQCDHARGHVSIRRRHNIRWKAATAACGACGILSVHNVFNLIGHYVSQGVCLVIVFTVWLNLWSSSCVLAGMF